MLEAYASARKESSSDAVITLVLGIVGGALAGAAAGGVGGVVLGSLAGGATASATIRQPVGGAKPVEIVQSYLDALDKLNRNLSEEGAELATQFHRAVDNVVTKSRDISRPLPVVNNYDDFQSPFRPAGGKFDEKVQQELDRRPGSTAGEQEPLGPIQRALGA